MKTTSGSIKRATSGKKNFGEIIILASRFHVIRQWRMVQNRPVSRVCFVPNRHQSKKSSFLLHSDLYFAACPLSKNEQLACVQTPLEGGGFVHRLQKRVAKHFLKRLTPIILSPLVKCLCVTQEQ